MWKQLKNQRGFTLIELVVVIAILGVLAAVAVPMISNYLSGAKQRAWNAEQEQIQNAVDAFYGAPDNTRFIGKRQYPVIGRGQTSQGSLTNATTTQTYTDDGSPFDGSPTWNPLGGTQGADLTYSTAWEDVNNDGVRSATSTSLDKWNSTTSTRNSVNYQTDPRYYFIDFEVLVTKGLLSKVPESASSDNKTSGTNTGDYTGSYIWYVNDKGQVKSLYKEFPDTAGFVSGVFP